MGLLLLQYKSLKVEFFYPYHYITRYGHFLSIIWSQKSIKIHKYVQIIFVTLYSLLNQINIIFQCKVCHISIYSLNILFKGHLLSNYGPNNAKFCATASIQPLTTTSPKIRILTVAKISYTWWFEKHPVMVCFYVMRIAGHLLSKIWLNQ